MANGEWSSAQSVSATLRADSTQILIGDYLNVRLTVTHPANVAVRIPAVGDTLGAMEVISASKIDTASAAGSTVLSQVYTVSAYDSGDYQAGPVKIYFGTDSTLAPAFMVHVNTLDVDTSKPFKAIKPPLTVPYSWQEFIPHILVSLLLIAGAIAAFFMFRKKPAPKPIVVERPKPKEPAHIWARNELKKLEQEKLWQHDEVKLYYSRLTDILRLYLEYRYRWFALESTTEEIEAQMDKYHLKEKAKENLLSTLRAADLVKFAKMLPLPDANMKAMENANRFIDFTEEKVAAANKSDAGTTKL
jgi:hypothetical protein